MVGLTQYVETSFSSKVAKSPKMAQQIRKYVLINNYFKK
jgi:hypothetical protein